MSRISNNLAFASIGLPDDNSVLFSGRYSVEYGHAFRNSRQKVFFQSAMVQYKNLNSYYDLRLPAAVLARLQQPDPDTLRNEKLTMKELLKQENGKLHMQCPARPLTSKVVSSFASPRKLPNGQHYFHSGLDLRARTGTPILASMHGTVSFADEMTVPGKVVVLDHGGGLYTRYMHLNDIHVEVGQTVEKGEVLGLSGATGRVEAPHLHWEVVWKGNHADPLRFLAAVKPFCDPE